MNTKIYGVYSYYKNNSELFKDVKRWYLYQFYSSKQSALNRIKKEKTKHDNLLYEIRCFEHPYAKEYKIIYTEDI